MDQSSQALIIYVVVANYFPFSSIKKSNYFHSQRVGKKNLYNESPQPIVKLKKIRLFSVRSTLRVLRLLFALSLCLSLSVSLFFPRQSVTFVARKVYIHAKQKYILSTIRFPFHTNALVYIRVFREYTTLVSFL